MVDKFAHHSLMGSEQNAKSCNKTMRCSADDTFYDAAFSRGLERAC